MLTGQMIFLKCSIYFLRCSGMYKWTNQSTKNNLMQTVAIVCALLLLGYFAYRLKEADSDCSDYAEDAVLGQDEAESATSQQPNQDNMESKENKEDQDNQLTRGIMLSALDNLGCNPTSIERGALAVKYQGENFLMEFSGRFVRVWDPGWANVKVDDPDMPKIRDAVNEANFEFGPCVVMTTPDSNGIIYLHSRRDIMLHPSCQDNDTYVKSVLDSFFFTKEKVRGCFNDLVAEQAEAQRRRRPAGFNTETQEE